MLYKSINPDLHSTNRLLYVSLFIYKCLVIPACLDFFLSNHSKHILISSVSC